LHARVAQQADQQACQQPDMMAAEMRISHIEVSIDLACPSLHQVVTIRSCT
jgi:hypothetical protein